jgi:ribonucrease Y
MLDFFLSQVKGLLSSQNSNSKVATPTSKKGKKAVKKGSKSSSKKDDKDNNRVVFTPKAPTPQPVVPQAPAPQPVVPSPQTNALNQAAQAALQNARKIEAETKAKEGQILKRLSSLDDKERYLIQKERSIDQQSIDLKNKVTSVEDLYHKQLEKLETISGLDIEAAKKLIISSTEKKMSSWVAKKIEEARDEIKQKEDEITQEVIIDNIRHGLTDYVAEYTVSTISLKDETVKGKIIGREGRNIRAFEKATGVELELDEGNDIRISSFDSTRREIARIALEKLIKDGRIQPLKIEQVVAQTKTEMEKILINEGKKICQEVKAFNLPIDLIKAIGKYKFRFSYGQNLAKHTIEATKIAVATAYDLKANVNIVRLGALFHDIGKVVSDQEGTHIDLGVDLLRKYRVPEKVIDCVMEHHEDKEFSSVESVLVYLGDAASGARPGARYEVHEEYLKRMKNIEEVAKEFNGVLSVAAYQAGREVVVIVEPSKVSDSEAQVLSQDIAQKLDEEAKWAGQIKVTVIRELRTSSIIVGNKLDKNTVKES